MRIVFYNHTGMVSGAEKMLLLSLKKLPQRGYEVILVCPEEGALAGNAIALGVPTYLVRAIRARYTYNPLLVVAYVVSIVRALMGLRKTFRSLAPDAIQANTVRAGIVATLATLGMDVPVIWHSHDILPAHPLTKAVRFLAHCSQRIRVVACSQAAADSIQPFEAASASVRVIHNGIEGDQYRPNPAFRRQVREEQRLDSSTFVIGNVGQITPRKGQLGLIRAFAALRERVPNVCLLIIGAPLFNDDQHYLECLEHEVRALGVEQNVRFLGQRKDVPALMQAMDLLVLNSDVEPFALVLVEALTMGKAVIATRSGGTSELIQQGVSGELVPVRDHTVLVAAMSRLAQDPGLRQRYGEAAERRALEEFTAERYIDKWVGLYPTLSRDGKVLPSSYGPSSGRLRALDDERAA